MSLCGLYLSLCGLYQSLCGRVRSRYYTAEYLLAAAITGPYPCLTGLYPCFTGLISCLTGLILDRFMAQVPAPGRLNPKYRT